MHIHTEMLKVANKFRKATPQPQSLAIQTWRIKGSTVNRN